MALNDLDDDGIEIAANAIALNGGAFTDSGLNDVSLRLSHPAVPAAAGQRVDANDMTAPSLSAATVNGATLTLTWDEALDPGSVPAESAFTVTVAGSGRAALADTNPVAINGRAVTLTLANPVAPGATVTVSYTAPSGAGANPIRDEAGNEAGDLSNQAVTNRTPGVLLSRRSLTLSEGGSGTYTVALATAPSGNVTVAIASDNGDVTIDDTDSVSDGVQNTLRFTTGNWSTAQAVRVRAATDADTANDRATLTHTAAGGGYGSLTARLAVTVTDPDADDPTPPSVVSASVDRAALTLTWNAALDASSVPAPEDFEVDAVSSGGDAPERIEVTGVRVSGATVNLTLGRAVEPGERITLRYTPGANPIRGVTGAEAEGITALEVTVTGTAPQAVVLPIDLFGTTANALRQHFARIINHSEEAARCASWPSTRRVRAPKR